MQTRLKTLAIIFTLIIPVTAFAAAGMSTEKAQEKIYNMLVTMSIGHAKLLYKSVEKQKELDAKYLKKEEKLKKQLSMSQAKLKEKEDQFKDLPFKVKRDEIEIWRQYKDSYNAIIISNCSKLVGMIAALQTKVGSGGVLVIRNYPTGSNIPGIVTACPSYSPLAGELRTSAAKKAQAKIDAMVASMPGDEKPNRKYGADMDALWKKYNEDHDRIEMSELPELRTRLKGVELQLEDLPTNKLAEFQTFSAQQRPVIDAYVAKNCKKLLDTVTALQAKVGTGTELTISYSDNAAYFGSLCSS